MTDDELERRLYAHYRGIDEKVPQPGLAIRIGDALDSRRGRSPSARRARPAYAVLAAALLIVAVGLGLGLRPGGFLTSAGASSTPTTAVNPPTASPSPRIVSPSPSSGQSSTPTTSLPSGSIPPVSSAPWTNMRLAATEGGPVNATSVVAWSDGYLALGLVSVSGELPAWISRDGRSWVELPSGTFGAVSVAQAAPSSDGVLVAVDTQRNEAIVWHSTDGVTWTSSPAPAMRLVRDSDLAGGPSGAVAVLLEFPYQLAFSSDGVRWQNVSLPGSATFSLGGVASFGTGFVAVGSGGTGQSLAWWSSDGLHWSQATVQAPSESFFDSVHAASGGLVATSSTGTVPGLTSFWTSVSGRSWTVSSADPLGVWKDGEGEGSANGLFQGDGFRLLGYGMRAPGEPTEYWASLDATHWTRLMLAGDATAAVAGQVTPFLLRDGVLFAGDRGSWFGTPVR